MRQFLAIKERVGSAIVFFRLGDFYEMFFEDAVVAAPILDVTLTTRDRNKPNPIPMCGVPHFAGRSYIAKLTERGFAVAICEQVEDPKSVKGIVRREVIRIVTPGCVIDEDVLTPWAGHYVAALAEAAGEFAVAYLDVSTGEFRVTATTTVDELADELARISPREVLADGRQLASRFAGVRRRIAAPWQAAPALDLAAADIVLGGLARPGLAPVERVAAARVLAFVRTTQPTTELPVRHLQRYRRSDSVMLSEATIAHLELTQTMATASRKGSLIDVLDQTVTAAGARCLRRWLLYPLTEIGAIAARADKIADLVANSTTRAAIRASLASVRDLERLVARVVLGAATPRDVVAIRSALAAMPDLAAALAGLGGGRSSGARPSGSAWGDFGELNATWTDELTVALTAAMADQPPVHVKDGGVIRDGHDTEVDECRRLAVGAQSVVEEIETRERTHSGIATLRVRSNRVFGLYIEVSKGQLAKVPAHYMRKQTVVGGERYVTEELAQLETRMLTANERLLAREAALWQSVLAQVAARAAELSELAHRVAQLDALVSLAHVAEAHGWVRPVVDESRAIDITAGRHPVVEMSVGRAEFVPNDCVLNDTGDMWLLTGPNMAGKSTLMRQVALIVVLAQMGSFVPATAARVGIVDRLFTRVGAGDNVARGDSTFMVEMRETAEIMRGATARSLVLLDEVGRGTATLDGLAIARAVAEYMHDAAGARTLFATHYHELTDLAETHARIVNMSMAVSETPSGVVFLRRVGPGPAARSYGLDVARAAGLPDAVLTRAQAVLTQLEAARDAADGAARSVTDSAQRLPASDTGAAVMGRLARIDINALAPIAAWQVLAQLVEMVGAEPVGPTAAVQAEKTALV